MGCNLLNKNLLKGIQIKRVSAISGETQHTGKIGLGPFASEGQITINFTTELLVLEQNPVAGYLKVLIFPVNHNMLFLVGKSWFHKQHLKGRKRKSQK